MYNGIGLTTPRGSGTNGYVQRNLSHIPEGREKIKFKTEEQIKSMDAALNRGPNVEILRHEQKRKIELKCLELKDLMEDEGGYTDEEVQDRVSKYRVLLMKELAATGTAAAATDEFGRPIAKETHAMASLQADRNQKLREAFGISSDFIAGSSMSGIKKQGEAAVETENANIVAQEQARVDPQRASVERKSTKKRKRSVVSESDSEDNNQTESEDEKEVKKKRKKHAVHKSKRATVKSKKSHKSPSQKHALKKKRYSSSTPEKSSRNRERAHDVESPRGFDLKRKNKKTNSEEQIKKSGRNVSQRHASPSDSENDNSSRQRGRQSPFRSKKQRSPKLIESREIARVARNGDKQKSHASPRERSKSPQRNGAHDRSHGGKKASSSASHSQRQKKKGQKKRSPSASTHDSSSSSSSASTSDSEASAPTGRHATTISSRAKASDGSRHREMPPGRGDTVSGRNRDAKRRRSASESPETRAIVPKKRHDSSSSSSNCKRRNVSPPPRAKKPSRSPSPLRDKASSKSNKSVPAKKQRVEEKRRRSKSPSHSASPPARYKDVVIADRRGKGGHPNVKLSSLKEAATRQKDRASRSVSTESVISSASTRSSLDSSKLANKAAATSPSSRSSASSASSDDSRSPTGRAAQRNASPSFKDSRRVTSKSTQRRNDQRKSVSPAASPKGRTSPDRSRHRNKKSSPRRAKR